MKILILGNEKSTFVKNLAEELVKREFIVHIFDPFLLSLFDIKKNEVMKFSPPPEFLDKIPKLGYLIKMIFIRRVYKKFKAQYDICNIHFNLKMYSDISRSVKNIGSRLVVTMYGSDFYRKSEKYRRAQKKIYKLADKISFSNEQTKKDFLDYYGHDFEKKTVILRLGLRPLEYIDKISEESREDTKKALNIPADSLVVTCGYNASRGQNHKELIENLLSVKNKLPPHVFLVFPMTYRVSRYRTEIEDILSGTQFRFKIFDQFLSDLDVARLRKSSEIMINIPQTDQLSGSMLEHLYADNIVITGSWLPYDILYEKGGFLLKVDSSKEIGHKLIEVIDNFEKYKKQTKKNKAIVNEIGRWDKNINPWIDLYKSLNRN